MSSVEFALGMETVLKDSVKFSLFMSFIYLQYCVYSSTWWDLNSNRWQFIPGPAESRYKNPTFVNSIAPGQLASEEAIWSGSALFVIKYANLYQKFGSSNLIGWKIEVGMTS